MGNQFKFWWRCIQQAWLGCRMRANEPSNRVIGRSKLFFLKSRHRLRARLQSRPSPRALALKARTAIGRKTTLALRSLRVQANKALEYARRHLALLERRLIRLRYDLQSRLMRHGGIAAGITIIVALVLSLLSAPIVQNPVGDYFNAERFAVLRGLLSTIGGALVGATAIGFR